MFYKINTVDAAFFTLAALISMTGPGETADLRIGALMADGSVYAGLSPATCLPMFAQHADAPHTMNWQHAITYATNADALGYTDWRVPTAVELKHLYNHRASIGGFNTSGRGWYWSSSAYRPNSKTATSITFGDGAGFGFAYAEDKGDKNSVRLIRYMNAAGADAAVLCNSRTISSNLSPSNGNRTVKTEVSGPNNCSVIGTECADGSISISPATTKPGMSSGRIFTTRSGSPEPLSWHEAVSYCQSLTVHGHHDWRLPTLNELALLYHNKTRGPLSGTFNEETDGEGGLDILHWSAENSETNDNYAWGLSLDYGEPGWGHKDDTLWWARCVRSGP